MSVTHVVELTPPGRAAVAVVLVAGPDALRAVGNRFSPVGNRQIADLPPGRIVLGRWGGVAAATEELIVCRRGEEQVEIHCHGGAAAVRAVMDALTHEGCQALTWQDWLRRSSPDPIRAAAQIALADAVTARTAAVLLDQFNGALSAAIRAVMAAIAAADWLQAAAGVDELLGRRDLGLHLTRPWRVVLAGAPNVGKSSLINALAGYARAIVSPVPGTTRDVVTVTTAIDGWPVQLADTAGLREGHDELESAGVELARATLASADLVVLVQDVTAQVDVGWAPPTIMEKGGQCPPYVSNTSRVIHVRNKIDLVSASERGRAHVAGEIATSAITGEGISDLVAAIGKSLVPAAPPPGSAVPFTLSQFETLSAARDALEKPDAPAAIAALQSLLAVPTMNDEG